MLKSTWTILLFPDRLVAGRKILALLTMVRIHLWEFLHSNFPTSTSFKKIFIFYHFSWRGIANYSYVILSEAKYLLLVEVWDSSGKFVIYFIIPIANPSEWLNYNELISTFLFPLLPPKVGRRCHADT